jgi:hypothetical protein
MIQKKYNKFSWDYPFKQINKNQNFLARLEPDLLGLADLQARKVPVDCRQL